MALFGLIFLPARPTHAGLLSLFGDILDGRRADAQEIARNYPSTFDTVLAAAINPDPHSPTGGGGIIIDDNALIPAVSPEGTALGEVKLSTDQIARYTVRTGDTLSSIARMFGVSVNTIRWSNDLSSGNTIRVGQELLILPIDGVRYTVKKGDTLVGIAKKFKGDLGEIVSFNDLDREEDLEAGTQIVIPDGVVIPTSVTPRPNTSRIAQYSGPAIVGYFMRPISGARTQGLHGNNGVDLGAPTGTPVAAAAAGEVLIARVSGWNGGYGLMVVISHPNGTQTLYGHLSKVDVVPGQYVVQGETIGKVGSTGRSTGPHLHFEVRGAKNPF